ncbi:MAG: DUF2163 domain-containing protein [Pseudomonadota bacterium]
MKTLSPELQAHLDTGATTLAWCWRVIRADGAILGFTDHDRDLQFDGTMFEANAGLTSSEITESLGLSVDNLEIEGAISSDMLAAEDLAAGLYDDARVEIWRVNWGDVAQRVRVRVGTLGEVKQSGAGFSAEVRGIAHLMQQERGRIFQYTCDANVGDARCGIDLTSATYRGEATIVSAESARRYEVAGLEAYAAGWFARGTATFTTGAASNYALEVKAHTVSPTGAITIELWADPSREVVVGDRFAVTAGCDKHLATCKAKFANAANYRGFPHMPGNDFLTRVAGRNP